MKIFNTLYKLCAAVLVASAFVGCVKEEAQMPKALLAASSLTFEALDAEPQVLTVASDASWVIDAPEWISVDPTSGEYTVDVTVQVSDNVDSKGKLAAPRDGVITIKDANSDYTVTTKVHQKGDTYLGVPETNLAGLAALDDESRAKATESQVVALASNGFIATDASATMYILGNQDKVKVGDKVTMNGTVSTQFGVKVFTSDEIVAVAGEYTEPTAKDVTEGIAAYKPAKIEYVKITGTLIGTSLRVGEAMGAATLFSPAVATDKLAVHNVVAYGYALLNDGKTLYFVPTKFEDKGLNEDLTFYPLTWTFAKDANKTFESDNRFEPASGLGFISYVPVNLEATNKNNKFARTIGSTGEPYVTGAWPGDYWLFTGYGAVKAGTEVHITYETRTSPTGHKFWRLEYLDGEVWKPAGEVKTTSEPGEEIVYTHEQMSDGKTNIIVDEVFRFNKNMEQLQIRFLCLANWQSGGEGKLEARNGGTVRLSVSEGNGYIYPKIEILKEGDGVERPDTDPVYANVSVSSDVVTFEGTPEGPQQITIVSDYDFRISERMDWIELDKTEGLAGEEMVVTISCLPSELSTLRKGEIEIASESTKKIVHVVQSAAGQELDPYISLSSGNNVTILGEGEEFSARVQTNTSYEVEMSEWITDVVEETPEVKAMTEWFEHKFTAKPNTTGTTRTGFVRFVNKELGVESVLNVSQENFVARVDVTAPYKGPAVSGYMTTISYALDANIAYKVSTEATWITLPATEGVAGVYNVPIAFAANDSAEMRQADIIFTNTEYEYSKTVTVYQYPAGIYFYDDFSWLNSMIEAYNATNPDGPVGKTVETVNKDNVAPRADNVEPFKTYFASAFAAMGYESLSKNKVVYIQDAYLKLCKTDKNGTTALRLSGIPFGGTKDAVIEFDWAAMMQGSGSGYAIDGTALVIIIEGDGTFENGTKYSDVLNHTQQAGEMFWNHASVNIKGASDNTKLTIVRDKLINKETGALDFVTNYKAGRWFIDNIVIK